MAKRLLCGMLVFAMLFGCITVTKAAEEEVEPEIELIDTLPGVDTSYSFTEIEVAPEATLPPSK